MKLSEIVEPLFLYHPWKFQVCTPFPVVFIDLQMSKIKCVNYAHFPKSIYICQLTYIRSVQKYLHAYIIKHVLMYVRMLFLFLNVVLCTSYTSSSMDSCLQRNLLVRYHNVLLIVLLKRSNLYWVCILGKYICVYIRTYIHSCFLHVKILYKYVAIL